MPAVILERGPGSMTDREILDACTDEGFTVDRARFVLALVRGDVHQVDELGPIR